MPFMIMLILLCASTASAQESAAEAFNNHLRRSFQQTAGNTTATGTSTAFNPAISVNGLFLGHYTSDPFAREPIFGEAHDHEEEHAEEPHEEPHTDEESHAHGLPENTGLSVQEIEIRFSAIVDAYFKADMTLAIPGTENIELEEGTVETTHLPNLTVKAGKFYAEWGKHNTLHTHAYPFLDLPVTHERLFGGEGFNEVGIGASLLLPAAWFSELTGQILNGDNALFNSPKGEDLAYLARWKNLWDLNDNTTLELGGSYALGKNEHREVTHLFGGDLTLKWRPAQHIRDRGFVLQAEYLQARVNDGLDIETAGGFYTLTQYQFARRWWIQARYDLFGLPKIEPEREHRFSTLLALAPSEFSALRLQHSLNRQNGETVHQLSLQLNITLGAHPAHAY